VKMVIFNNSRERFLSTKNYLKALIFIVIYFTVTDLVEAIKNCPTLKYLELEGNTLGVNAAIEIGKALESKPEFEAALWKDLFTGRLKNEIPQAMVKMI